jgi:hypothetical protein
LPCLPVVYYRCNSTLPCRQRRTATTGCVGSHEVTRYASVFSTASERFSRRYFDNLHMKDEGIFLPINRSILISTHGYF